MCSKILTKCVELFPELFKSNKLTEEKAESLAITEVSAPDWARDTKEEEEERQPVCQPPPVASVTSYTALEPHKLDYEAIREELAGHSVRAKVLLMQALRWVNINDY